MVGWCQDAFCHIGVLVTGNTERVQQVFWHGAGQCTARQFTGSIRPPSLKTRVTQASHHTSESHPWFIVIQIILATMGAISSSSSFSSRVGVSSIPDALLGLRFFSRLGTLVSVTISALCGGYEGLCRVIFSVLGSSTVNTGQNLLADYLCFSRWIRVALVPFP